MKSTMLCFVYRGRKDPPQNLADNLYPIDGYLIPTVEFSERKIPPSGICLPASIPVGLFEVGLINPNYF